MEGEVGGGKIVEELDNLWFFCNVLCSSKLPLPSPSTDNEKINSAHLSESPKSNLQEEPMFPTFEDDRVLVLDEQDQIQTNSELNLELQNVEPVVMEAMASSMLVKEQQQMSRARRRSYKNKGFPRRRAKGEQKELQKLRNFGFASGFYGDFEGSFLPMFPSFHSSGNPYLLFKIPPLNDGMAMKEHLRSWAHAVACAVR